MVGAYFSERACAVGLLADIVLTVFAIQRSRSRSESSLSATHVVAQSQGGQGDESGQRDGCGQPAPVAVRDG
jgi:hypothetical protein